MSKIFITGDGQEGRDIKENKIRTKEATERFWYDVIFYVDMMIGGDWPWLTIQIKIRKNCKFPNSLSSSQGSSKMGGENDEKKDFTKSKI